MRTGGTGSMKTHPYLELHCSSSLAPWMVAYVEQKRALGRKSRTEAQMLNMFDDFCIDYGLNELQLPQDLYDAWCAKRPHENGSTHASRVQHIRHFARFLTNNGVSAPTRFFPLPRLDKTFVPYIFTRDE